MSFYDELEEKVRPFVKALRDAGINTTCSCHHEGYIECASYDPTEERRAIWDVMRENTEERWTAQLRVTCDGVGDAWIIRSAAFALAPRKFVNPDDPMASAIEKKEGE